MISYLKVNTCYNSIVNFEYRICHLNHQFFQLEELFSSLVKRYFDKNIFFLLKTSIQYIPLNIHRLHDSCMTNSSLPLIGITPDSSTIPFTDNHNICSYILDRNLKTSVLEAGGIPLGIFPVNQKNLSMILDKMDGLVLYKNKFSDSSKNHDPFEQNLLQYAWEKNIPILAIAGGACHMTFFLQGELYKNIQTELPESLPHIQINSPYQGSHCIQLQPKSCLYSLTKRTKWMVNSFHQSGIKSAGKGIPSALAEDNTIEAIEDPSRFFFVGVQWHPEFAVDYTDRKLFSALIAKARTYAQNRS